MSEQQPRPAQQIISVSSTRPAIKLGEWIWENDDPNITWTRGPIKTPPARPAIRLEWSDAPETPEPTLRLTLQTDPEAPAIDLALGIFDLMTTVNELERSLGGSGLKKFAGAQSNGTVTITLKPEKYEGAADRLRNICEQCNRSDAVGTQVVLPVALKAIEASVS